MFCKCFVHGMKIRMCFLYHLIFSRLFSFINFGIFAWNAIILYRQWILCGIIFSYSFAPIILKFCKLFLHGVMMCVCFVWYFSYLFILLEAFWTFSAWKAMLNYRQLVLCEIISYYSLIDFILCWYFPTWNEYMHTFYDPPCSVEWHIVLHSVIRMSVRP